MSTVWERRPGTLALIGISTCALGWFVVGALGSNLDAGFVADDFTLLVEDSPNPWYFARDYLYRPVRNVLAHLLPQVIGWSPFGYRVLAATVVVATIVAFFALLRLLGATGEGALAGAVIAAYYPRHSTVYYWWSASQDAFMVLLLIGSFIFWARYRRDTRRLDHALSVILFAIALGFKEPAICFPALLLGWDLARSHHSWREARSWRFWRPYTGFALAVAAFGVFVLWYPWGRFHMSADTHGTYGFFGVQKAAFAWVRTWINLVLPFGRPLALRDLTAAHGVLLASVGAAVFLLQRRVGAGRVLLLCAAGISVAILPNSFFASNSPGDQYLYMPSFFVAGFLGHLVGELVRRDGAVLATAALLTFLVSAGTYLTRRQREWQSAGELAETIVSRVRAAVPASGVERLTLLGPPHSRDGAWVFNNGMRGALILAGYSPRLRVALTHGDGSPPGPTEKLVERILPCRGVKHETAAHRILIVTPGDVVEVDRACAQPLIDEDRKARSWAWLDYSAR